MTDESQVVRSIDWKSLFPFTLIFRSFRIAVHPSKLILALAAILTIFVGGKILDGLTPAKYQAVPGEVDLYADPVRGVRFSIERETRRKEMKAGLEAGYDRYKLQGEKRTPEDLQWMIKNAAVKREQAAEVLYDKATTKTDDLETARDKAILEAWRDARVENQMVQSLQPVGLFEAFVSYQISRIDDIVMAVRRGNWIASGTGVAGQIRKFVADAPTWAVRHHPVFFAICLLFMLAVWAVFGGAIARIAAVHVARDEKISIRQALRFSIAKFLSFFSAPLIPLIIITAIGLLMAVGGMLTVIPGIGPIIVGAGFFLLLLGGFIISLVFIGWVGGSGLMYPTIAVEGSDSFDAISRSFSYLYARPWRLAFYTIVALIYGAICYLFVRYFIYIMLLVTQRFSQYFVFTHTNTGEKQLYGMWPGPSATNALSHWPDYFSLGPMESTGAFLIWFWTSLVVSMLGAFAISFYFSAGTVIYMLLRHDVDATEMDDVYIDQPDEEFTEAPPAAAPVTAQSAPAADPAPQEPQGGTEQPPPANA